MRKGGGACSKASRKPGKAEVKVIAGTQEMGAARIVCLAFEARKGEWAFPLDRTSLVRG